MIFREWRYTIASAISCATWSWLAPLGVASFHSQMRSSRVSFSRSRRMN